MKTAPAKVGAVFLLSQLNNRIRKTTLVAQLAILVLAGYALHIPLKIFDVTQNYHRPGSSVYVNGIARGCADAGETTWGMWQYYREVRLADEYSRKEKLMTVPVTQTEQKQRSRCFMKVLRYVAAVFTPDYWVIVVPLFSGPLVLLLIRQIGRVYCEKSISDGVVLKL